MVKLPTKVYGALFIVPCVIVMAVLVIYPMISVFWLGFQERSIFQLEGTFVGFANFVKILNSQRFWAAAYRTLFWTVGSLAIQFILGLISALLLFQKFRGKMIVRGIVLFPYIVPTLVAVVLWKWMFNDLFGVVNYFLITLGITEGPLGWMSSPDTALFGVIIISIWKFFPFVTVLILARLQTIPLDLFDAAKVDGASKLQELWYVILPQLKAVAGIIILLRMIWNFGNWDIIYIATRGGPGLATETISMFAYTTAFREESFGLGGAIAVISFFIIAAISLLYIKVSKPV